ncbi:MAG: hypothetical protein GY739_07230, partial [Mesoflavibacter sp.]|nr:hypothetical protein [Mesoflavibacter sp.]
NAPIREPYNKAAALERTKAYQTNWGASKRRVEASDDRQRLRALEKRVGMHQTPSDSGGEKEEKRVQSTPVRKKLKSLAVASTSKARRLTSPHSSRSSSTARASRVRHISRTPPKGRGQEIPRAHRREAFDERQRKEREALFRKGRGRADEAARRRDDDEGIKILHKMAEAEHMRRWDEIAAKQREEQLMLDEYYREKEENDHLAVVSSAGRGRWFPRPLSPPGEEVGVPRPRPIIVLTPEKEFVKKRS